MSNQEPLATLDDEILVEYRQFGLRDVEATEAFQGLGDPVDGVLTGPGVALFLSDANDHFPAVRFESWPHKPPAAPEPWTDDDGIDETIELPSGAVQLWELVGGPSPHTFRVGLPGRYRLRVQVRSFAAAVLEDEAEPDELFQHGVERWLMRFWPTT